MTQTQRLLLAWGEQTRRDLPWRRTRDPWAVLVSELMLQQTQVARVEPKYHAFLTRFPTVDSCAASTVGEVVTHWSGLGYNRRAVNLQRASVVIVSEHDGQLPESLDALLRLPGIGPYTARAVLAFAFEHDVGVVDTNAARVLARQAGERLAARQVQEVADVAVPTGAGWAWNQAMLDLGATICTSRSPACTACPISSSCAWWADDLVPPDPSVGSAGVGGRQSRFEGSDRQGRGRLVQALRDGRPISGADLPRAAGWPDDPRRAERAVDSLVADGLAVRNDRGDLTLP